MSSKVNAAFIIRNNVHVTIYRSSNTAENIKTDRVLSLLNATKVRGINVGKLCDILSIQSTFHTEFSDLSAYALSFLSAIRTIPIDASPAVVLIHTTMNWPHNNRGISFVVFIEEISNNLAV